MKKTLKIKIFASFMLLIAMLATAGAISIAEFRSLGNSVHNLIRDNYRSIEASRSMLEALEREDSGILLLVLGEWEQGRSILSSADSIFVKALAEAKTNITEPNERFIIDSIATHYAEYKSKWKRPIVDTNKQGNVEWYQTDIHRSFLVTKAAVNSLMQINQMNMYDEANVLTEKSKRAIMPGIVSIVAAVVFSLLLSFFISRYFVRPIHSMIEALLRYQPGQIKLNVDIRSDDEMKLLERSINEVLEIASKWKR